jgi:hypothetical protein
MKLEGEGALHVAKNPLDLCEMGLATIMHKEIDMLNRVCQVRTGHVRY